MEERQSSEATPARMEAIRDPEEQAGHSRVKEAEALKGQDLYPEWLEVQGQEGMKVLVMVEVEALVAR